VWLCSNTTVNDALSCSIWKLLGLMLADDGAYSLDDAHIALLMQLGLTHQGHDAVAAVLDAPVLATGEVR